MTRGAGPDRREAIASAGCLGISWALPGPLERDARTDRPPAAGSVVLFLNGGNDAASTVVPHGPAEHACYARIRRHLALERAELLPMTERAPNGERLGLHPACRELHDAVETGQASIALHVGPGEPHGGCHHRATESWHRTLGAPPRRDVMLASLTEALLRAGRSAQEGGTDHWLDLDGFDLHQDLLRRHARLWTQIDIAIGAWRRAFQDAPDPPPLTIASEFGRALEPRGTGADHGGPGHAFRIVGRV